MTRVVCVEARKILVKSSAFMAPVKDRLRALLVRIRPFLGGRDWIYLLALLVPLIVYDLVLKGIRIHSEEEHAGLARVFELIRSDLLFNLGYALLWIGLFALARRGLLRWLVLVLFHASAVLVVAITTCAHFYFEETGSTLDLNVIVYSLTTLGEINDVIASVTSPAVWALAVAALCYVALAPWLMTWLICRWTRSRNAPTRASRLGATVVCLAGVALAFFSVPVESGGASVSFSRDAVVNVLASRAEYARLKEAAADAGASP